MSSRDQYHSGSRGERFSRVVAQIRTGHALAATAPACGGRGPVASHVIIFIRTPRKCRGQIAISEVRTRSFFYRRKVRQTVTRSRSPPASRRPGRMPYLPTEEDDAPRTNAEGVPLTFEQKSQIMQGVDDAKRAAKKEATAIAAKKKAAALGIAIPKKKEDEAGPSSAASSSPGGGGMKAALALKKDSGDASSKDKDKDAPAGGGMKAAMAIKSGGKGKAAAGGGAKKAGGKKKAGGAAGLLAAAKAAADEGEAAAPAPEPPAPAETAEERVARLQKEEAEREVERARAYKEREEQRNEIESAIIEEERRVRAKEQAKKAKEKAEKKLQEKFREAAFDGDIDVIKDQVSVGRAQRQASHCLMLAARHTLVKHTDDSSLVWFVSLPAASTCHRPADRATAAALRCCSPLLLSALRLQNGWKRRSVRLCLAPRSTALMSTRRHRSRRPHAQGKSRVGCDGSNPAASQTLDWLKPSGFSNPRLAACLVRHATCARASCVRPCARSFAAPSARSFAAVCMLRLHALLFELAATSLQAARAARRGDQHAKRAEP